MSGNAAELYKLINADPGKKQDLFRQALQDPKGALEAICALGIEMFACYVRRGERIFVYY